MKRQIEDLERDEQIEIEKIIYEGVLEAVGLIALEEFKDSLLGHSDDLRYCFKHAVLIRNWLYKNDFELWE